MPWLPKNVTERSFQSRTTYVSRPKSAASAAILPVGRKPIICIAYNMPVVCGGHEAIYLGEHRISFLTCLPSSSSF